MDERSLVVAHDKQVHKEWKKSGKAARKAYRKKYKIIEIPYVQKEDKNLSQSKSNPNIFYFFYLGYKYFLRLVLTILKNKD